MQEKQKYNFGRRLSYIQGLSISLYCFFCAAMSCSLSIRAFSCGIRRPFFVEQQHRSNQVTTEERGTVYSHRPGAIRMVRETPDEGESINRKQANERTGCRQSSMIHVELR